MAWSSAWKARAAGFQPLPSEFLRTASKYLGSPARPAKTLIPVQKAAGCHRSLFHCEGLASCQSAAALITFSRAAGSMVSLKAGVAGARGEVDGGGAGSMVGAGA